MNSRAPSSTVELSAVDRRGDIRSGAETSASALVGNASERVGAGSNPAGSTELNISSRWHVAYQTAIVSTHTTEADAWRAHDEMVCRGLDPDALAVVRGKEPSMAEALANCPRCGGRGTCYCERAWDD